MAMLDTAWLREEGLTKAAEGLVAADANAVLDADADGLTDAQEGDGDADGDGIPDRLESNFDDADSDGIPDDLDTDSDSDGLPDAVEGTGDSDGDGIPDRLESNSVDTDSDGTPDAQDEDSDNDGLPDILDPDWATIAAAGGVDSDGDGLSDVQEGWSDSDRDGVPDRLESNTGDSDGDGTPEFLDPDLHDDGADDFIFDGGEDQVSESASQSYDASANMQQCLREAEAAGEGGSAGFSMVARDSFLASIADAIGLNGSSLPDRRETFAQLDQSRFLTATQQLSCSQLALSDACAFDESAAGALSRAAAFVYEQKAVPTLLPHGRHLLRELRTGHLDERLQLPQTRAFFQAAVRADVLKAGIAPPTPTLGMLRSASPGPLPARDPTAAATGAACSAPTLRVLDEREPSTLTDGSPAAGGVSYPADLRCEWLVLGPAEAARRAAALRSEPEDGLEALAVAVAAAAVETTRHKVDYDHGGVEDVSLVRLSAAAKVGVAAEAAGGAAAVAVSAGAPPQLVELTFPRFFVWQGDRVVVRDAASGDLIATLSGEAKAKDECGVAGCAGYLTWPPLVAPAGFSFVFESDHFDEAVYVPPGAEPSRFSAAGFLASLRLAPGCSTDKSCGPGGVCRPESGLCECGVGRSGADCSYASCLGVRTLHGASGVLASSARALEPRERYVNDAVCGWRLAAGEETGRGRGFLRLSIEYDVEPSFDFVEVYDGSGTQHAQLSGAGGPVLLTIPVDGGAPLIRFTSDGAGRRSGFRASYKFTAAACDTHADCSGRGACVRGLCACEPGTHGLSCDSKYCLAYNPPAGPPAAPPQPSAVLLPPAARTAATPADTGKAVAAAATRVHGSFDAYPSPCTSCRWKLGPPAGADTDAPYRGYLWGANGRPLSAADAVGVRLRWSRFNLESVYVPPYVRTMSAARRDGGEARRGGLDDVARSRREELEAAAQLIALGHGAPNMAGVAAVNAFYAAVDTKDFAALERAVRAPSYLASFGPECAVIGGATHCGEETLDYEGVVSMLRGFDGRANGTIARELATSSDGSMVVNHYNLADGSHGSAVHSVEGGVVTSSFWYQTRSGVPTPMGVPLGALHQGLRWSEGAMVEHASFEAADHLRLLDSNGTARMLLAAERCKVDFDCGRRWQTGSCDNGLCSVRPVVNVRAPLPLNLVAVADRHARKRFDANNDLLVAPDGDAPLEQGVAGEWEVLLRCPVDGADCAQAGGTCSASPAGGPGGILFEESSCLCPAERRDDAASRVVQSFACDCPCTPEQPEDFLTSVAGTLLLVALGLSVFLSALACWGLLRCYRGLQRALIARQKQEEAARDRVHDAILSVVELRHPAAFVAFDRLRTHGALLPHETLRDRGELTILDSHPAFMAFVRDRPTVFCSHQWLAWDSPDPNNVHYPAILAACERLCELEGVPPDELYVWVDYVSIPQANEYLKWNSIGSLGTYASACRYFVVVAPPTVHTDTGMLADEASYARRGWVRLEQWAHLCVGRGLHSMYFADGVVGLTPLGEWRPHSGGAPPDWLADATRVFEGDFTLDEDRLKIVDTVLGLWAMVLSLSRQGDSAAAEVHEVVMRQPRGTVFPPKYFNMLGHDLPTLLAATLDEERTDDSDLGAGSYPGGAWSARSGRLGSPTSGLSTLKRPPSGRQLSGPLSGRGYSREYESMRASSGDVPSLRHVSTSELQAVAQEIHASHHPALRLKRGGLAPTRSSLAPAHPPAAVGAQQQWQKLRVTFGVGETPPCRASALQRSENRSRESNGPRYASRGSRNTSSGSLGGRSAQRDPSNEQLSGVGGSNGGNGGSGNCSSSGGSSGGRYYARDTTRVTHLLQDTTRALQAGLARDPGTRSGYDRGISSRGRSLEEGEAASKASDSSPSPEEAPTAGPAPQQGGGAGSPWLGWLRESLSSVEGSSEAASSARDGTEMLENGEALGPDGSSDGLPNRSVRKDCATSLPLL